MPNILIINAHHYYPGADGSLNETLVSISEEILTARGYKIKKTYSEKDWSVQEELDKHTWADFIILQSPVYWMLPPWSFKKYMDEVYSPGMNGILSQGDGRHRSDPKKGYGTAGTLKGKKYMISLTFNAPEDAFNNPREFFQGKSVDDLWFPIHMNYQFFGMEPLPTFACFDVSKNSDSYNDIERFKHHIQSNF